MSRPHRAALFIHGRGGALPTPSASNPNGESRPRLPANTGGDMPSSNPRYARGSARSKLRKRLAAEGRGCWICRAFGRPDAIDYSLPARHPRSFEVDELVPVSKGGSPIDYANVDATHRECNNWRGNRGVGEVLEIARAQRSEQVKRGHDVTSREW